MNTHCYRPNKGKVLRDILIVSALIFIGNFIRAGLTSRVFLFAGPLVLGVAVVYMFIMGILPYIKISDSGEIEYRTDYGLTHRIRLSDIKKITKGSGLGGYEHALFVYHDSNGVVKRAKIKSSYFDRRDIVDLIASIRKQVQVETNEELEDYLAGRKTKYSWKL